MNNSVRYQDTMDASRVVEPVSFKGNSALCRIYWREGKRRLQPGGMAVVPASLFVQEGDAEEKRRIGFVPIASKRREA